MKSVIFAYPGVTGFLHQGHIRGQLLRDLIIKANYIAGNKVFFPAGLHATGNNTKSLLLKKENSKFLDEVKELDLIDEWMALKSRKALIGFFKKIYARTWKKLGFAINYPLITTIDNDYQYFVKTYFELLAKKGFIKNLPYFGPYCEVCGPVQIDNANTEVKVQKDVKKIFFSLKKINNLYIPVLPGQKFEKIYSQKKIIKVLPFKKGFIETSLAIALHHQLKIGEKNAEIDLILENIETPSFGCDFRVSFDINALTKPSVYSCFTRRPTCKCGEKIFIKKQKNELYILYDTPRVKELFCNLFEKVKVFPESQRETLKKRVLNYPNRAFLRKKKGNLGTYLTIFKKKGVIESISDSNLYSIYYFLKNIQQELALPFKNIVEDYFFNENSTTFTNLQKKYPLLSINIVGKEHLFVHLPRFFLTHIMLFGTLGVEEVLIHGYIVKQGGEKISKSDTETSLSLTKILSSFNIEVVRLFYITQVNYDKDMQWTISEAYPSLLNSFLKIKKAYALALSSADSTIKNQELEALFHLCLRNMAIYNFRDAVHILLYKVPALLFNLTPNKKYLKIFSSLFSVFCCFSFKNFKLPQAFKVPLLCPWDLKKTQLEQFFSKKKEKVFSYTPQNLKGKLESENLQFKGFFKKRSESFYKKKFTQLMLKLGLERKKGVQKDNKILGLYEI
jgi:leucyl-tRNA synthetase